ncbi:MAG TPA: trypsin-like peptidase domain-containing protein [Planctomycetaceae bacterium]|nr:trypsin-like peptidase domain-containing protein [Planctomycetaceae bacterium]
MSTASALQLLRAAFPRNLRCANHCFTLIAVAACCAGVWNPPASASERRLSKSELKDGTQVHEAFREVVVRVNASAVAVLVGGRQIALGVIVSPDGYILTKASDLSEDLQCQIRGRGVVPAVIVGIHNRYDVALLKVELSGLPAVEWAEGRDLRVGQWLATPGMDDLPVAVGIVSVARRPIPPEKGALGLQLSDGAPGPKVTHVVPGSAAARAGVQIGDIIVRAGDQRVDNPQSFDQLLHRFAPGDSVSVVVRRGAKQLTVRAVVSRAVGTPQTRGYWMNRMSGRMSHRRAGFPQAIQHDTVLSPEMCGGPVVDLSGKAVGVNIARAGRVETYAVPADTVKLLIRELRGGPAAASAATSDYNPDGEEVKPKVPPEPTRAPTRK